MLEPARVVLQEQRGRAGGVDLIEDRQLSRQQ